MKGLRGSGIIGEVKLEYVRCDLCRADAPLPYLQVTDRFSGDAFHLVKCSTCGLIYLNPRPTAMELSQHYPDDYEAFHQPVGSDSAMDQWHAAHMWKMQLDFVEKFTRGRGRLLDVGCATGEFLHTAQTRGWQVRGVELIDQAARSARERYNLEVETGTLDTVSNPENGLDAITLWDVLEHLPSPLNALLRAHQLLIPGGWVVFSIPNLTSFDRFLFGRAWIGWDAPRHFFLFTETTLQRLLHQAGFELLGSQCLLGGKGTFFLSLERLLGKGRLGTLTQRLYPLIGALLWPYRQFAYLLKRGPIITYAARKV